MQPNNLTALDFEDIKASIKSYLRTRKEFSDYDFDGSALSYLIDMLAYNTYYTSFNANMAVNEAFLSSATIRDNIVNIAKLLNYVPESIAASRASLSFEFETSLINGSYPSTAKMLKGPVAVGGGYTWSILDDVTVNIDSSTGVGKVDALTVYEGSLVTSETVVDTFKTNEYEVPTPNADISTLKVSVKPNERSTTSDLYTRADNITDLDSTTRIYFLSEGQDMRYKVKFGDDVIGRKLSDGEVVQLTYLVTNGAEANEVQKFNFRGRIQTGSGDDTTVASANVAQTKTRCISQLGEPAESVESIKYNAPRYYATQNRAVTSQDYSILTKKLYNNADTVVAYGGDLLNPPIYGKVYIAIKTKTGSPLNDATKNSLEARLRTYSMASIDPVIVDPDEMYIYPKVFVQYNPSSGANTSQLSTNIQSAIQDWGRQTQINNFNSVFRNSAFSRAISGSDSAISDVSNQISVVKYIKPDTNQTNTYCINIGSGLYDSNPSNDGSTDCKKEPVVLSGTFRTADRPGVDQQFEDDGFGKLQTFFNTGSKKYITNADAGSVDYNTGKICFGPVNIVGAGPNVPAIDNIDTSGTAGDGGANTGAGSVIDPSELSDNLKIPVLTIPANPNTIPSSTPGTVLSVVNPEITVAPIGTIPPPSIPLNSLTPQIFDDIPNVIDISPIDVPGSANTSACF